MKKTFYKFIIFILSFLGFSSLLFAPQYGVFTAKFKLDGKVVNEENEKAIKNINVILNSHQSVIVETDENGEWVIDEFTYGWRLEETGLIVRDVDGEENGGHFKEKTIKLILKNTEEGDGNWYMGTYEQHNIIIELEKNE